MSEQAPESTFDPTQPVNDPNSPDYDPTKPVNVEQPAVIGEPGDLEELPYGNKPGEVKGPDGEPIVTDAPAPEGEETPA